MNPDSARLSVSGGNFSMPGLGALVYATLIAASSLSGALLFTVSILGRATPASATKEWLLLLGVAWLLLMGWALLYAGFLQRTAHLSRERSLCWAALCHTPLLLGLGAVAAVYGSDLANHIYTSSPYGIVIFQPLSRGYVILAPALTQILLLCCYRWRGLVRALPLAGILTASLVLRLWNLNWGLPGLLHPDEHQYVGRAFLMMGTGDLNPRYFENPSLMIYVTYALYELLSQQAQPFHVVADFFQWGVQDPRGDYLIVLSARAVSAAAGALTTVAVYVAGREILGRGAGLMAATVLGTSFLHVRNSHYATNDVLATAFLALSLLYSLRIYTRGRTSDYLLAALFGGLGTSAKYNVGLFAAGIVVAHLVRRPRAGEDRTRAGGTLLLIASAAVSFGAFVAGTPYMVLDFPTFLGDFRSQWGYGASAWHGQEPSAAAMLFLTSLVQGFGLIPLALSALGIALMARRDGRALAVLISVPAVYLLFMSTQRLFFVRFAIPVLPFLALAAGYALREMGRMGVQRRLRPLWTPTILIAALAQPVLFSAQHNLLLGREDTRWLAARWIDVSLPPEATMAMESYAQLDGKFGWKGHRVDSPWVYWPENEKTTARALGGSFGHVVITSFGYGPRQRGGDPPSRLPAEYGALEREGRLVVSFGPGSDGQEIPYSQDDVYTPFWHLFDRVRPGPAIRIYQRVGEGAG